MALERRGCSLGPIHSFAAASAAATQNNGAPGKNAPAPQLKETMNTVKTALGLEAGADEAAILGAVSQLKNRLTTLEQECTALKQSQTELLESRIDHDLSPYENRLSPQARGNWRKLFLADHALASELIQSLAAQPASMHNRNGVGCPTQPRPQANSTGSTGHSQLRQTVREYKKPECLFLAAGMGCHSRCSAKPIRIKQKPLTRRNK